MHVSNPMESTATAGKKDTITRHKSKMQKRLLYDTLNNTYLKVLC